jgi:hypothetical protein
MQRLNFTSAAVMATVLYGVSAFAADSGIILDTTVVNQKVAVRVATANPTSVSVQTSGLINTDIKLQQSHSGSCLALVEEIAAGVCVPSGPGGPVSPN